VSQNAHILRICAAFEFLSALLSSLIQTSKTGSKVSNVSKRTSHKSQLTRSTPGWVIIDRARPALKLSVVWFKSLSSNDLALIQQMPTRSRKNRREWIRIKEGSKRNSNPLPGVDMGTKIVFVHI
jgi:hypothetical protein